VVDLMRVNMDSSCASDPRFKLLGKALGISWREAIGSSFLVWLVCYDRRSEILSEAEIDIAAEISGFCSAFLECGLAEKLDSGIQIKGVMERISFLSENSKRASKGGIESGKSRRLNDNSNEAETKRTLQKERSGARSGRFDEVEATHEAYSLDLDLDQAPDLDQDLEEPPIPPKGGSRSGKKRKVALTEAERASCAAVLAKLGERTQISYRGSQVHLELIAARLREGIGELDLRKVIAYCAEPKETGGLGWQDSEEMRQYLRPETLFGKKKIACYLDAALAWAEKNYGTKPPLRSFPADGKPSDLVRRLVRKS
jgi:uncharacterized phage protein (TIGR02220 family)